MTPEQIKATQAFLDMEASAHDAMRSIEAFGALVRGMMAPQGELRRRRALSITGHTAQTNVVRNVVRRTFTADEARHAMGIYWLPMSRLSQAIPPAYTEWIGTRLMAHLTEGA